MGSLAAFAIVCLTVIYLRITSAQTPRPFRTPLFPLTPILGMILCIILLLSLMAARDTRNFFLTYTAVGVTFYFAFGLWNSKLARGETVVDHEAAPMELPKT